MCLHLITYREGETWVNQSCLKADIWLGAECCITIRDRSKCQPNQLRYAREWRKVAQEGGAGVSLYNTYRKILKVMNQCV